jgi:hypothetical protein
VIITIGVCQDNCAKFLQRGLQAERCLVYDRDKKKTWYLINMQRTVKSSNLNFNRETPLLNIKSHRITVYDPPFSGGPVLEGVANEIPDANVFFSLSFREVGAFVCPNGCLFC